MLTTENFDYKTLTFRDRQAGVSVVYDPLKDAFSYNAYCLEKKLLKDIYAKEFGFLQDALDHINSEFGTWEVSDLTKKAGCGTCVAKKH